MIHTSGKERNFIPMDALTGSLRDFRTPGGTDMLKRAEPFCNWQDLRCNHRMWPYARSTATAPITRCEAKSGSGRATGGVNFASQDYLGLGSHPQVKEAAIGAIRDYGVHSAGSAALPGITRHSLRLEQRIGDFFKGHNAVLYPTGWSAGFAAVQGVVHPDDHVVMDVLAHSCLKEGARAATANIHFHGHLNLRGLERRLQRIRAVDATNGVLVVTESLFSMHADTPDFAGMSALCKQYDAMLLVDCTHDLGCIGADGLGHLGLQNALAHVDIIFASFSNTFASNGGFIAVKTRAAAEYLKHFSATQAVANALSPVQAATVLAAFDIVQSAEGVRRRRKLMDNILYLRKEMTRSGLEILGDPSPIVPVCVGAEGMARIASRELTDLGAIANLAEYPAVPQGGARFKVQLMSDHTRKDIDLLVRKMRTAMEAADAIYRDLQEAGIAQDPVAAGAEEIVERRRNAA